jgi:hypothetical protein
MKLICSILLILALSSSSISYSQESYISKGLEAINQDVLKAQLGFLSSDWMEGREAYEKGAFLASDYIAGMLRLYGAEPFGDPQNPGADPDESGKTERSYFQNFVLLKTLPGEEQIIKLKSTGDKGISWTTLTNNTDFLIPTSEHGVETEAPVVFAGYGYTNDSTGYDDFAGLNVKGKIILKLSGFPKFVKGTEEWQKTYQLILKQEARYKALGILGVMEFNPDEKVKGKPAARDFMTMSPAEGRPSQGRQRAIYSLPGKEFNNWYLNIYVSSRVANEILRDSGISLEEYIAKADKGLKAEISQVRERSLYIKSSVITSQVAVRNVLGIIKGQNPDNYIVVGAHYDHLGMGNGFIWNGADDNGSGTVGVMTIAKAVAATGRKPENSIVFALWTAEEEGLLGSRYWVRNPDISLKNVRVNVNFDMISRYITDSDRNKATMTYTSTFPWFKDITMRNVRNYDIDLKIDYQASDNPPGGTDHRSFVEAGIPVIRIKPGHREEYHTPKDEISTVNWDIMEKIVRLGFADVWELAERKW